MADPVKIPNRDVVVNIDDPGVDVAEIESLLFESLSSLELTKFTKYNTVSGINPFYNTISNLSDINREFDPNSLLSATKTTSSLFDVYGIDLLNKIPPTKSVSGSTKYTTELGVDIDNYVSINQTTGDIEIELVNIAPNESLEIEVDTSGTIYRVRY